MIDAADPSAALGDALDAANTRRLSLRHTLSGRDPEQQTAFSEVYPPLNFVKAIESRRPELLTHFRCMATRRAVVRPSRERDGAPLKLIEVDDVAEELYNLTTDPLETVNTLAEEPAIVAALEITLEQMAQRVARERDSQPAGAAIDLEGDELLRQRLRGLGYLE